MSDTVAKFSSEGWCYQKLVPRDTAVAALLLEWRILYNKRLLTDGSRSSVSNRRRSGMLSLTIVRPTTDGASFADSERFNANSPAHGSTLFRPD
jgi:hypothetical protein